MSRLAQRTGLGWPETRRPRRFHISLTPRPEKDFQQAIIDLARTLGYLVFHVLDARGSAPGFPDLVIVGFGRLIFAEIKSRKGTFTTTQLTWLAALDKSCAEVYRWRDGVDDVRDIADVLTREHRVSR